MLVKRSDPRGMALSPRLPRITASQLLRALQRDGWEVDRQQGGHVQLVHPAKHGLVTVPRHTDKTIPPKILESILDQAELTADELRELL